jgi:hypothetical protein
MIFRSVFTFKGLSRAALAVAAALAFGSLPAATDAAAHPVHGGHGGGGFHGGYHGGGYRAHPGFGAHRGPGFRGAYHRPYAVRYYRHGYHRYGYYHHPYYHYHYYGCYRWRYVATPWGWRLRRVNVCYPSRYYYVY